MHNEQEIREQICGIGRRMYGRRMVAANDGNISVRISEDVILCTPTGVSKGFMKPEQMCKIDLSGKVLEAVEGFGPSSEVKMHLRVYQKRPDIKAVVHAHPIFATSFAVMGRALDRQFWKNTACALRDTLHGGDSGCHRALSGGVSGGSFGTSRGAYLGGGVRGRLYEDGIGGVLRGAFVSDNAAWWAERAG